jgi:hypothetical protein
VDNRPPEHRKEHNMSHDTFYICPHCERLADLPEVQWACNQHVLTRARRGEKPGKYVVNYEGDLLVVGKAVASPCLVIGDPLVGDRYGVLRDASRHLDKFGVLHDCPICGAEVQVTLYQCENCCKPVRPAQVATCDVFHPPVGLAAANLVLQHQGPVGDQKARWVA